MSLNCLEDQEKTQKSLPIRVLVAVMKPLLGNKQNKLRSWKVTHSLQVYLFKLI